MKYILYFLLLISIFSCKTKNVLYTDYVLVEKTDGSKDTLIHKYWNKFTWDEYKMEWFIKSYNLNVEDISNIKVLYVTKQKFSNKELGK
jgi:hypothetical protein